MNRYTRWTTALITTGALLALAAVACADVKTQDPGESQIGPLTGPTCDLTGYKSQQFVFNPPLPVPDATPTGITTPPISFPPDGMIIDDVIVDLNMVHTWVGDLIVTVQYDLGCDGTIDRSATLLCRPRGTAAVSPPPCGTATGTFGCGADLITASAILWSDDALAPLAEGTCVNPVPPGCYKPATVGGQPLSVFRGMLKNGCFTLFVSDNGAGDTGTINSWSVHVRNRQPVGACCLLNAAGACVDGTTPMECLAQNGVFLGDGTVCTPTSCATDATQKSWGTLKSIYR